jgi:hypothetical protein
VPRGRRIGFAALCGGLAVLGGIGCYFAIERPRVTGPKNAREANHVAAARLLSGAAAVLSFSVLTDSALEHYRGAYHNPAMYLAPTVSGARSGARSMISRPTNTSSKSSIGNRRRRPDRVRQ